MNAAKLTNRKPAIYIVVEHPQRYAKLPRDKLLRVPLLAITLAKFDFAHSPPVVFALMPQPRSPTPPIADGKYFRFRCRFCLTETQSRIRIASEIKNRRTTMI